MPGPRRILMLLAVLLALSGCSTSMFIDREQAWRRDAESICLAKGGFRTSAYAARIDRISQSGTCGIWYPLKVSGALQGYVAMSQPATVNCNIASAFDGWLHHVVQPAAMSLYGSHVREVKVMGGFACRTRNSRPGAKISEHAFGNAIDVGGFVLANGREISVLDDWNGDPFDAVFLRAAHQGGCRIFTTVIGPDGDRHHRDHFHLDLARHNADNSYRYCK